MLYGSIKWMDEYRRGYVVADGAPDVSYYTDGSVVCGGLEAAAKLHRGVRVSFNIKRMLGQDFAVDITIL